MTVELRHLRYFVAVAEELSFTRAAQRLHMSQPPLSTQIRDLEHEVGVNLVDRSRRTIRLTQGGEVLLGEARRLLVQVDQALRAVQRAGEGEVGRLTVGFVPSATTATLPGALRTFRERHPGVELYLREMAPNDLVAALHAGGVDVCFLYLPFAEEGLEVRAVSSEPLIAALPADHPLAAKRRLAVADLCGEDFVLPAQHRMPGLLAQVLDTCRAGGFTPTAVQKDIWLMQTILGLVAAGLGVALIPASVEHLHRTGVAFRPLRDAPATVQLGALWRTQDDGAVLQRFLDVLPTMRLTPRSVSSRG
jgi:DNA-binding transcriptional LysR family regulator